MQNINNITLNYKNLLFGKIVATAVFILSTSAFFSLYKLGLDYFYDNVFVFIGACCLFLLSAALINSYFFSPSVFTRNGWIYLNNNFVKFKLPLNSIDANDGVEIIRFAKTSLIFQFFIWVLFPGIFVFSLSGLAVNGVFGSFSLREGSNV
ncbi:hypothetical protein [Coralliovum pocilloporae]|uniref:hypothetical protein n=1 Tax=Coralliovum pocilloporae TaxID=3066369 RepID=UPI00330768E4